MGQAKLKAEDGIEMRRAIIIHWFRLPRSVSRLRATIQEPVF